jgi:hypothetical protein
LALEFGLWLLKLETPKLINERLHMQVEILKKAIESHTETALYVLNTALTIVATVRADKGRQ